MLKNIRKSIELSKSTYSYTMDQIQGVNRQYDMDLDFNEVVELLLDEYLDDLLAALIASDPSNA